MRMHQVEVDDEVFQFVKTHAEPLVDNFNSTLRRLLPLPEKGKAAARSFGRESRQPESADILPAMPIRTPQALRQILEVVHLVLGGTYNRSSATQYVARHHKVAPQTVIDKYTRQLSLTAGDFDELLEQEVLADLQKILKSKFPSYSQLIDEIINR